MELSTLQSSYWQKSLTRNSAACRIWLVDRAMRRCFRAEEHLVRGGREATHGLCPKQVCSTYRCDLAWQGYETEVMSGPIGKQNG
jgi:hypothetical protein